jgi:hypothetical protein
MIKNYSMPTIIKEVQPSEIPVNLSNYMEPIIWCGIYTDGTLVGYGCVSKLHGQYWAHDLLHWGKDVTAIVRLYRYMIPVAKERGVSTILTDVSNPKMIKFYRKLGWLPKSLILEGVL